MVGHKRRVRGASPDQLAAPMMEQKKTLLTATECIAFALECQSSAEIEHELEHRERLLRIASTMREIAAALKNHEGTKA